MSKYRIGYLDEDEGTKNTFYQNLKSDFDVILIDISKDFIPGNVIDKIIHESLDLVVIDYMLNNTGVVSFNGDEVVKTILQWNPYYPILMLTSYQQDAIYHLENVNIINDKNVLVNDQKTTFFLKIKTNIERYHSKKELASSRIREISTKKLKNALTPLEEEEYYSWYRYLNDSSPGEKILASDFYTPEKISNINEMLVTAKELLNELKRES